MKTLIAAGALSLLPLSAVAHATLEQRELPAGSTAKITLRVPHGCGGEATHTVRIDLPEGFYNAKPMPKPGWDLSTGTGPYATPYDNHGTEMTKGTRTVIWSGGHLEDGWYDEFTIRGSVSADIAPGSVLYFPALQTCANGTADWTDTSGAEGVDNPAPKLTVIAATEDNHHQSAPVTLGDLTLSGAFSRATLPNAPVGGGFLTIANTGADDHLVSARSDAAARVEIHEMSMEGEVMTMRPLPGGLPLPAGQTVALTPGGYHLMFMGLTAPLVEGQTVEVTLTFERAGEITLPFIILAPNARAGGHQH